MVVQPLLFLDVWCLKNNHRETKGKRVEEDDGWKDIATGSNFGIKIYGTWEGGRKKGGKERKIRGRTYVVLLDNLEETSIVEAGVLGEDIDLGNDPVDLNLECSPSLFLGAVLLEFLGLGTVVFELSVDLANLDVLKAIDLLQLTL
jgi:hypothetical protein